MAKLITRKWLSRGPTGHKVRRVAYGYTLQVDGKRERKVDASWTKEDAENALAARQLERDQAAAAPSTLTFGEAVDRYLAAKSRKRSIKGDERNLMLLKAAFGAETPLVDVTAARISAWKTERLAATCAHTKAPYSAAPINRPLAALRHLLRLACQEWEVLPVVPRIRLEREPEGRVRWLEPDEERRLLEACRRSRTKHLADVVTRRPQPLRPSPRADEVRPPARGSDAAGCLRCPGGPPRSARGPRVAGAEDPDGL